MDHGLDTIEVSDNGSGITESDWPLVGTTSFTAHRGNAEVTLSVGLKHHTSKLPSLSTLAHVRTFGFRGEAISSLCALCESVIVTTSTKESAPMGAVIKLGRDGRVLDSSGRIARPVGFSWKLPRAADAKKERYDSDPHWTVCPSTRATKRIRAHRQARIRESIDAVIRVCPCACERIDGGREKRGTLKGGFRCPRQGKVGKTFDSMTAGLNM